VFIKMAVYGVWWSGPRNIGHAHQTLSHHRDRNATPPAYFRSFYHIFDFTIVASYWLGLALTDMNQVVQIKLFFRALSALRPLRLLSITEGLSV
jgi:hypothetical protein